MTDGRSERGDVFTTRLPGPQARLQAAVGEFVCAAIAEAPADQREPLLAGVRAGRIRFTLLVGWPLGRLELTMRDVHTGRSHVLARGVPGPERREVPGG